MASEENAPHDGERQGHVRRFSTRRRVEHLVILILFFTLTFTGLPQKFSEASWAGDVVRLIGGVDLMRLIHRMAGLGFAVFTVYFLVMIAVEILLGKTAPTMVPFLSDLREVHRGLLWTVGLAERPKAGRFDYREKLEFWGMLVGSLLMVVTGLILYFPIEATRWLTGELIPAAKTAHSFEAMLALMVIVLWHLYNTIFRPSVFPLDRAMFTGKISVERLREEHTLEYERMFPGEEGGGKEHTPESPPPAEK